MADQRRNQLDARQALASQALRRNLAATEAKLYADLEAVTDLILSTPPEKRSPAWLYQQARYRELIASVDQEMAAYGGEAARQITDAQAWAQQQGRADAAAMGAQAAGLRAGDFLATNLANASAVAGFMVDGTPLSDLFATYGPAATREARQVLTNAVVLGWGADKTARAFRDRVTGMPARRAELIARTELHRVYRSTSRDVYQANQDVLTGWVWLAKLDTRTCATCIIMSGTMHSVGETLDGHPRCRCVMVPITGPWQAIDPRLGELKNTTAQVPTGADWLKAQPPATQKAVLGATKYDLYRRGQIDLPDLVKRDSSPEWGTMRREATVAEARAAASARGVRQVFARKGKTATQLRQEREAVKAKLRDIEPPKPPPVPTKAELREQLKRANEEVERRVKAMNGPDDVPALLAAHEARNRLQEQLDAAGAIHTLDGLPKLPAAGSTRAAVVQANTNPDYGLPGYDVNCVHVTQAYEMRRRGYDVEATSLPMELRPKNGRSWGDSIARNWTRQDGTPLSEADVLYVRNVTGLRDAVKSWGPGSRGVVRISWKGGGGHVYSVENVAGQPLFRELQTTGPDTSATYFQRAKEQAGGRLKHLWVTRLDDKLPTDGLLNATDPTIRPAGG